MGGGSDDWPEWLPADWTVNIRKIDGRTVKCYVDSEGQTCYSKSEVFDYLKKTGKSIDTANTQNADDSTTNLSPDLNARPTKLTPRTSNRKSHSRDLSEDMLAGDGSSSEPLSSQRDNRDSWLPEGWTVEVKVRKGGNSSGMKYKCYTDPASGQKFFSKPQVMNFLAKTNGSADVQKEAFTEPISATPISAWQEKSTTEPNTTQVKKTISGKKESARFSSNYEVFSRTPVEGLPAGWIKEVRIRKHGPAGKKDPYFLDPLSEYAFFSKKDALRYLESGDIRKCVMKPLIRGVNNDDIHDENLTLSMEDLTTPSPSKVTETPKEVPNGFVEESKTNESGIPEANESGIPETNESGIQSPKPIRSISGGVFSVSDKEKSDWLPDGWSVEVQYKNSGMKFKVFKELASGKRFYSKPQVLNYLAGGSSSNSAKRKESTTSTAVHSSPNPTSADAKRPKRGRKKHDDKTQDSDFQEVITTSAADGLPPGWIKEIRTKIYATHKRSDPFYTDPVSGYIFRSKLDAMRFLDTGDVNLCAIRPKVKDKDGKEVFVFTNGVQKPAKPTTGKGLSEDKEADASTENHEKNSIPANNTNRVSPRVKKQSSPAASTPTRSSKRQKGMTSGPNPTNAGATEGNGPGQAKQASWVNLEKQPADDGNMSYDIPEDDTWTDQCIDFAVKTLANEILYNGQPMSGGSFQEEKNETPTKVN
ncbi:putative Methyl-CpG-binding domain-containing protein [Helianthus debilis subsp. tardiflorus]